MYALLDQRARLETKKHLRALRLPYSANQILSQSLAKLLTTKTSRSWALPSTRFPDEVLHYSSRHAALGLKASYPTVYVK